MTCLSCHHANDSHRSGGCWEAAADGWFRAERDLAPNASLTRPKGDVGSSAPLRAPGVVQRLQPVASVADGDDLPRGAVAQHGNVPGLRRDGQTDPAAVGDDGAARPQPRQLLNGRIHQEAEGAPPRFLGEVEILLESVQDEGGGEAGEAGSDGGHGEEHSEGGNRGASSSDDAPRGDA